MASVARVAEMSGPERGRGQGLRRAARLSGLLVDRDPPEVHAAAAVAREVERLPIRRPDRVPVDRWIVCHGNRRAAGRGNRPDVPLRGLPRNRPERDPVAVRRPARLDRVAGEELPLLAGRDVDRPELRDAGSREWLVDGFGRDDDLLSVGRPGGVLPDVRKPPDRLARRTHDEDAAAPALGPERDRRAVRGERGLGVVLGRVLRQVDRVVAANSLEVDVVVSRLAGNVREAASVRRQRRELLHSLLVRLLRESDRRDARGLPARADTAPRDERSRDEESDREPGGRRQPPRLPAHRRDQLARGGRRRARRRLEVERHVADGLKPLLRVLLEAVPDDPIEQRREVHFGRAARLGQIPRQDRVHRFDRGVSPERALSRQHLVEDRAEGEDVAAVVGGPAAHLLGRHVADGAEHRAGLGRAEGRGAGRLGRRQQSFRQAEVEDLQAAVVGDEDVLGLEIPVRDSVLVRGGQAARDLQCVLHRLAARDRTGGEAVPQRFAGEELRDRVDDAVVRTEVVDAEEIRVREGGDGFGLALEARERGGVRREALGKDFDRDVAVELRVARAVDLSHASGAERPEDLVRAEACAGQEGHEVSPSRKKRPARCGNLAPDVASGDLTPRSPGTPVGDVEVAQKTRERIGIDLAVRGDDRRRDRLDSPEIPGGELLPDLRAAGREIEAVDLTGDVGAESVEESGAVSAPLNRRRSRRPAGDRPGR